MSNENSPIPSEISGVIEAKSITQVDRIHLVLLGEPGSGKSWTSCTAREPIFIFDNDDRRESIAGKNAYIKTTVDRDALNPTAWAAMEADTGIFEYQKSKGELKIQTIVGDSMTNMLKHAHNQMMRDNAHLCRKIKVNGKEYPIPQGWDSVNTSQRMLEGLINRWFELEIDVIITAHIRREKGADSTEKNPTFTGKWTIEPQNLKMLLPKFNERWFMLDDFKVQMKPNYLYDAVTALSVDAEMPANIGQILVKHQASASSRK